MHPCIHASMHPCIHAPTHTYIHTQKSPQAQRTFRITSIVMELIKSSSAAGGPTAGVVDNAAGVGVAVAGVSGLRALVTLPDKTRTQTQTQTQTHRTQTDTDRHGQRYSNTLR